MHFLKSVLATVEGLSFEFISQAPYAPPRETEVAGMMGLGGSSVLVFEEPIQNQKYSSVAASTRENNCLVTLASVSPPAR
jgi:hypothetical protein